jgi:hypothetical protein
VQRWHLSKRCAVPAGPGLAHFACQLHTLAAERMASAPGAEDTRAQTAGSFCASLAHPHSLAWSAAANNQTRRWYGNGSDASGRAVLAVAGSLHLVPQATNFASASGSALPAGPGMTMAPGEVPPLTPPGGKVWSAEGGSGTRPVTSLHPLFRNCDNCIPESNVVCGARWLPRVVSLHLPLRAANEAKLPSTGESGRTSVIYPFTYLGSTVHLVANFASRRARPQQLVGTEGSGARLLTQ